MGKALGLGGSGGDLAVASAKDDTRVFDSDCAGSLECWAGDSGVGCIRNGFVELALGVTGELEDF